MIEMAKSNQAKAKRKLEAVREKQKEVNTSNQKLLEKLALPAECFCRTIRENIKSK